MKSKLVMFLVVLFVVGGAVQAADSVAVALYNSTRGEIVPDGGTIFVYDSSDSPQSYEFQISVENDAALGGISIPLLLTSPDGATWAFEEWPGAFNTLGGTIKFIEGITGSRWMSGAAGDGSCWDLGGTLITEPVADADSFLIGGAAIGSGLAAGPMQHMLSAHFTFGGVNPGDPVKQICIDTSFYPPGGRLSFAVGGPSIIPGFSGMMCYSVSYYPLDADDANPGISYSFNLDQNRPNPFNPATTVEYSLARKSHVNISIYNILGQKVITLVDGEQEAGQHHAVWEGHDGNGSQVASGIYFYKMEAGDYVQTRKMALMR